MRAVDVARLSGCVVTWSDRVHNRYGLELDLSGRRITRSSDRWPPDGHSYATPVSPS